MALPYREYGILTGKISHISEDINSGSGDKEKQFPYTVRATIEGTTLNNNQNEKFQIRSGMISEARIVSHSRKIFYIVLDKLDFLS